MEKQLETTIRGYRMHFMVVVWWFGAIILHAFVFR